MLALSRNRISTMMSATVARYATVGGVGNGSGGCCTNGDGGTNYYQYLSSLAVNCNYVKSANVPPNFLISMQIARFYTSEQKPCNRPAESAAPTGPAARATSAAPASTSSTASGSSIDQWIDKQQVEKYFFKTVVTLWDFSQWAWMMSRRNFDKYVVQNPTVKLYWKQFVQKVEKARKS